MTTAPKSAKQPEDHKDKSEGAKSEATMENPVVEFNGETYEIRVAHVSTVGFMNMLERMSQGAFYVMPALVLKMIGEEAWARLVENNLDPELEDVSVDVLEEFFEAANEKAALGNS